MKDFILGFVLPMTFVFAMLLVFICLPLAWFDGHAKSVYLKQTQGIDIPWYQATFLSVEVNNVNAKVEQR